MAINQATLLSIRNLLKIKMMDNPASATTFERFSQTIYDAAINLAIAEIAKDTGYYERTVGVKTDAARLFFTLRGSNPEDVADDYLSMQKVIVDGTEIKAGESRDVWRDSVITPNDDDYDSRRYKNPYYYIQDEKLNFGVPIPASVEKITDEEDRDFTTTTGNWTATNGAISSVAGGYSGNAMKYVKDAVAAAYSQTLASTYLDSLVIGNYYVVSFWAKHGGAWTGGVVTVTCGNHSTTFTPTTSYQRVTLRFRADETAVGIVLTSASVPANTNEMWLDSFTFSDCVLVVNYHAVPQTLVADADTPPAPLNYHQLLLVNKSIVMLNSISPVDVAILDRAMMQLEDNMRMFKRDFASKGSGQNHVKHPTYV